MAVAAVALARESDTYSALAQKMWQQKLLIMTKRILEDPLGPSKGSPGGPWGVFMWKYPKIGQISQMGDHKGGQILKLR